VRYIDSYFVCFRPPYDLGRMHYVFRLSVRRCVRQCGGILRPACRRLLVPICVRFPRNDWRVRSYLENVRKRKLELLNAEKKHSARWRHRERKCADTVGTVPIQSAQCRFLGWPFPMLKYKYIFSTKIHTHTRTHARTHARTHTRTHAHTHV